MADLAGSLLGEHPRAPSSLRLRPLLVAGGYRPNATTPAALPGPLLRCSIVLVSVGSRYQEILSCYQEIVSCYSPFEDKIFTFPVPFEDRSFGVPVPFCALFFRGWLLSFDSVNLVLWNPVSGDKIELPQLIHGRDAPRFRDGVVAISPPPHYLVSIALYPTVFLLRWFDSDWVELNLPEVAARRVSEAAVSISGKHYHTLSALELYPWVGSQDLLVVDALATPPTFQFFEMELLRRTAVKTLHGITHLVEFGEEPLLVKEILGYGTIPVGFEVYRADLDRKMWVKVESVGDNRVIVIHWVQSVSLLAADIGARGNCIYFATGENSGQGPWKVFDLGTRKMTDLQLPSATQFRNLAQLLFVPSLC
ncbi:uncharacterized protein A4U43_C01F1130 [Asparagus officinalis]|uniref:KIB1-4 beta-propeller domain-containing protein n=1 Tax=Asparagus officinalis TaxID=4686 RepID=A0A5P1FLB9_ASPOF|nr:uncharacterized protein LOC109829069 [Asparagus officinalis]ONK78932.1 uncharacterized protein A4U43_C01F1130 [Asparagus officinalis]